MLSPAKRRPNQLFGALFPLALTSLCNPGRLRPFQVYGDRIYETAELRSGDPGCRRRILADLGTIAPVIVIGWGLVVGAFSG